MKKPAVAFLAVMVTLVVLTLIPGAFEATGSPTDEAYSDAACAECHEDMLSEWHTNVHARIESWEVGGAAVGCTSCHAGAEEHVDSGGDPDVMTTLTEMSTVDASAQCLGCHQRADMTHWQMSAHAQSDVGCLDCHSVHTDTDATDAPTEACVSCHGDVQASMMLPSHHPVAEGKMGCESCHNPHGTAVAGMIKTDERLNDLCFSCHAQLQGPFIFEHAPVTEDCSICHTPHGSVADNLLSENEPYLCLQCHEMHFHTGAKGLSTTEVFNPGRNETYQNPYTTFGWKRAFATKCTQCHVSHHGSDLPSQGVTSQGNSFTR